MCRLLLCRYTSRLWTFFLEHMLGSPVIFDCSNFCVFFLCVVLFSGSILRFIYIHVSNDKKCLIWTARDRTITNNHKKLKGKYIWAYMTTNQSHKNNNLTNIVMFCLNPRWSGILRLDVFNFTIFNTYYIFKFSIN